MVTTRPAFTSWALFLHGINTALVLSLARRLGAGLPAALLGALLFALVSPPERVGRLISGRTDVLAATFALGALALTLGSLASAPLRFCRLHLTLGLSAKRCRPGRRNRCRLWEWQSDESKPAGISAGGARFPTLLAAAISNT